MDITFKTILISLILYVYISVPIIIYAFYSGRSLNIRPIFGLKFLNSYFFGIGSFIGIIFFLKSGFEGVFFFIPNDWGTITANEWMSTREQTAQMISIIITSLLAYKSIEMFNKREKK